MLKYICCLLVLCITNAAFALELSLLAGWQLNRDFQVSEDYGNLGSSGLTAGEEVDLESGIAYGVAVDFIYDGQPDQRYGLYISHQQSELGSNIALANSDLDITHAHITFKNYYPSGKIAPFVLAGVGVGVFDPSDNTLDSEELFSGQLATGLSYQLSDTVFLRAEARWLATFFDGQSAIFCDGGCVITVKSDVYSQLQTNLGLMFQF